MKNLKSIFFSLMLVFSLSFTQNSYAMVTETTITPVPDVELISLEIAKKQCRVEADFDLEDDLFDLYINSSIQTAEEYLKKNINAVTIVFDCDKIENFTFKSGLNDVLEKIEYYASGDETLSLLDESLYRLTQHNQVAENSEIKFTTDALFIQTDVREDAVKVTLKSGYETFASMPKPIASAILLMVSEFYDKREDRTEINTKASNALLRPYRMFS